MPPSGAADGDHEKMKVVQKPDAPVTQGPGLFLLLLLPPRWMLHAMQRVCVVSVAE